MSQPLLQLKGISKSFSGVPALRPLDLELANGQVLGLIGENGAGKSTLIKILSGVHTADEGTMEWCGRQVRFLAPGDALGAGIATIHQELAFFGQLTAAENLLMLERWPRFAWGGLDWAQLYAEAAARLGAFAIQTHPAKLLQALSSAERQEIAIARAASRRAQLLILDEPTASLSEPEAQRLYAQLDQLRGSGVAVIYISHRLDEILRLSDRVVVLRDGRLVAGYPTAEASVPRMVADMVGRPLDQVYPHTRSGTSGPILLEVNGATRRGIFHDVSLSVRAGEIVGLAGLVGCGRSELARALFGLYPLDSGWMRLKGRSWAPASPAESLQSGLVYIPEERKRQGFVLEHSVLDSVSIGFSDLLTRWGIIQPAAEQARAQKVVSAYSVRVTDPRQPMGTLSGGNQQKVLLGRWLDRDPDVIILDEPTRGVDVAAKAEIHALIDRLAGEGKAVLLISSDLPELLGMSDRVVVMHEGRISAELTGFSISQEAVILAASGLSGPQPLQPGLGQGPTSATIKAEPSQRRNQPGTLSRHSYRASAWRRWPRGVGRRLVFLASGNALLLLTIALLLKEGSSFGLVLARAVSDLAPIVLAGLGLTAVIWAGAIDLSIGSIIAAAGSVFGVLVHDGLQPWVCNVACVGTAWLLSVLNGQLVRGLRIPAIIVTLAGLPLYRGLALIIADLGIPSFSGNISVQEELYHQPGKLYAPAIMAAGIALALMAEFFGRTPRHWLARGSSMEACELMGLNPGRLLQSAFGASGLLLGLAALIYVTRVQAIEPSRIALGFELQVIGAVVLGGTNIFGGEGSFLGTILGAFFLYLVSQVLTYGGASPFSQDAIAGALIVLVIGIDCALHRRQKRIEELG